MTKTLIADKDKKILYAGKTLIVDDMSVVYDKLKGKFANPEYADTLEKGLEKIASGNYDLIISDYHLSDDAPKGGLEIIRAAKARGLDCILMSRDYHKEEAEKLGARFIFKKKLLESENTRELIEDDDGRK